MERGVVLHVSGSRAIVFTASGRFVAVRARGGIWRPGDEVKVRSLYPWLRPALAGAAAAVAGTFLGVVSPWTVPPGRVQAYVTVGVDGGVRLAVDRGGRVVQVESLARRRPAAAGLEGGSLSRAVLQVLARTFPARQAGAPWAVLIAAAPAQGGAHLSPSLLAQLAAVRMAAVRWLARRHAAAVVSTIPVSAQVDRQAVAQGLPTGTWAVLLAARARGTAIPRQEVARLGLYRALSRVVARPEKLLSSVGAVSVTGPQTLAPAPIPHAGRTRRP